MRRVFLGASASLLVLLAVPPTGVSAGADGTGTVKAVVRYETPGGNEPLVGVEVWLGVDLGGSPSSMLACTDEHGIARFREVPADTDLVSATGPAVEEPCSNPGFLNPETGEEMTTVAWNDHHGEMTFDVFTVDEGAAVTLRFVAQTPDQRGELCFGWWATWTGTAGADRFTGTPDTDIVSARGGNDTIEGGRGRDTVCGGPGDDALTGGAGEDWLLGDRGDDELVGGTGRDWVVGGPGRDACRGETESDCE